MINLLDIVYCFVSKTIPFNSDISLLRESFINNGFTEKEIGESHWKYKRGAALALDFKYSSSEALEIIVFLKLSDNKLFIRVGNWGFPFEPLLMKKRFTRNLDRFSDEILKNGVLSIDDEEILNIKGEAKNKFKNAIVIIVLAILFITLF